MAILIVVSVHVDPRGSRMRSRTHGKGGHVFGIAKLRTWGSILEEGGMGDGKPWEVLESNLMVIPWFYSFHLPHTWTL